MTLPLELGGIHDPMIRRALEQLSQQFLVVAAGGGAGGAPSGPAGGVLGGTYPNPSFAADMATQAELDTHTGLTTTAHGGIVASTDPRLTDARAPTAHHATHEPGGTDAMAVDAAATTGSLRTIGTGALQAAAGNDSRLSNARTPTAHATTHQPGGTDAMAVDAVAGTGSLRTLGTVATSAAAGNRGLPTGGTSTQVLAKNSATDFDVGWTTPAVGAAPTYDGLQQGVVAAGDCALTRNSVSQVTIAAGTAYVTASGALVRTAPGSTVLSGIPAASASNFRLDQVVVSSAGTVSRLQGTQGTTVTMANRTGAASVPAGSVLLHDMLIDSTGLPASAANLRDRRLWARGAFNQIIRATNAAAGSNYTTASTTFVEIDTTNLKPRIECSGVPVRCTLSTTLENATAVNTGLDLFVDGATANRQRPIFIPAGGDVIVGATFELVPAAGSHQFSPAWKTSAGTLIAYAQTVANLTFTVEEIVRQNTANG